MPNKALTPYREPGTIMPEPLQKELKPFANGFLVRRVVKAGKSHKCNKPGFWKRLFKWVKPSSVWICSCGYAYEWNWWSARHPGAEYDWKEWVSLSNEERDSVLLQQGYANKWEKQ